MMTNPIDQSTTPPSTPFQAFWKKNLDYLLLTVLLMGSFLLFYAHNHFPAYYHPDEDNKCKFILEGGSSFKHPVLMLLVGRFFNLFFGYTTEQDIVELGRTTTAGFGVLAVIGTFLFASMVIQRRQALLVALAAALTPIIAIHAHYLKEDIIMTAFTVSSAVLFIRLVRRTSVANAILLGIGCGLAFSSKYVAFVLLPILLTAPFACGIPDKKTLYKRLLVAIAVSVVTFLLVNAELFFDLDIFKEGVSFEANHMTKGHSGIVVDPVEQWFSFHLIHSIIPGLTWPLAVPALSYIIYMIVRWGRTPWEERFFLLNVAVFYFSVELSPSKPEPAFIRYVIPTIPYFCYFAYRCVAEISARIPRLQGKPLNAALFALLLIYPAYDSINLVAHLLDDTRKELREFTEKHPGAVLGEKYTNERGNIRYLWKLRKRKLSPDTKYLAASSFAYERFKTGRWYKNNRVKDIPEKWRFYEKLFEAPYIEFKPEYRTYAFSNPTIRIIEIEDLKKRGAFDSKELRLRYRREK